MAASALLQLKSNTNYSALEFSSYVTSFWNVLEFQIMSLVKTTKCWQSYLEFIGAGAIDTVTETIWQITKIDANYFIIFIAAFF